MSYLIVACFLLLPFLSLSQDAKEIEKILVVSFSRIDYWASSQQDLSGDSLIQANDNFEELLLKYTSANEETLTHSFKTLIDSGLSILTSTDKKFRIYSWDALTGGTMHFYRNVFQFKGTTSVHSKTIFDYRQEETNNDCFYYELAGLRVGKKTYYVTLSISVGSTVNYYHTVKLFSITGDTLNEKAQLIKTRSGMQNELGYEIDLDDAGIGQHFKKMYPQYNPAAKTILLPLVDENGRVTEKKIKYTFNGSFFQKIQDR